MRRRSFLTLLGTSAAAWPFVANAQQDGRVRRIAVLMGGAENEQDSQTNLAAFRDGLARLGWVEGRNLRVELRFGGGEANRLQNAAAELVKLAPEVIFTSTAAPTVAVQRATPTIPIVFAGSGSTSNGVQNIARPEGNTTGFPILY